MKTLSFILTIFLLINIMVGCEEDVIVPDTTPEVKPTIVVKGTAYALPTSIVAGETTTINYSGSKDVTAVTINGTTVPTTTGSVPFTLATTTTFTIKFIGVNNKMIDTIFVVNVTEPPVVVPTKLDTIINLLCLGSFKKVKDELKINGTWDEYTIQEKETRRLLTFTKDGKVKDSDPLGIDLSFEDNYKISTDLAYITYFSNEREISVINDNQLVLISWVQGIDPITNQWVEKYTRTRKTYDRVK